MLLHPQNPHKLCDPHYRRLYAAPKDVSLKFPANREFCREILSRRPFFALSLTDQRVNQAS
jgi:hypothetical protein